MQSDHTEIEQEHTNYQHEEKRTLVFLLFREPQTQVSTLAGFFSSFPLQPSPSHLCMNTLTHTRTHAPGLCVCVCSAVQEKNSKS